MNCGLCESTTLYARGYCRKHYNKLIKSGALPLVDYGIEAQLQRNTRVNGECLEWTGPQNKGGYGLIGGGKAGLRKLVHRAVYEFFNGQITGNLRVCHRCDNHKCVRGDHLFLGTDSDNFADMRQKRRHSFGERHGRAKLTERDVISIRSEYECGHGTYESLAKKYSVTPSTIGGIVKGKEWRHLLQTI